MSQASLYHLVAEGKIPGIKVGKQWRFAKAKIDSWVQRSAETIAADVLVVEDDPIISNLVVNTMRAAGHHATAAGSVREALVLLSEIEFDLILLDLLLPDGSALDVVEAAVKLSTPPELLMVTGHPDHELIDRIHALLPDMTVLSKPVRLERLLQLTARAVSSKA
jgi:excisionase family DNA binding protein